MGMWWENSWTGLVQCLQNKCLSKGLFHIAVQWENILWRNLWKGIPIYQLQWRSLQDQVQVCLCLSWNCNRLWRIFDLWYSQYDWFCWWHTWHVHWILFCHHHFKNVKLLSKKTKTLKLIGKLNPCVLSCIFEYCLVLSTPSTY